MGVNPFWSVNETMFSRYWHTNIHSADVITWHQRGVPYTLFIVTAININRSRILSLSSCMLSSATLWTFLRQLSFNYWTQLIRNLLWLSECTPHSQGWLTQLRNITENSCCQYWVHTIDMELMESDGRLVEGDLHVTNDLTYSCFKISKYIWIWSRKAILSPFLTSFIARTWIAEVKARLTLTHSRELKVQLSLRYVRQMLAPLVPLEDKYSPAPAISSLFNDQQQRI